MLARSFERAHLAGNPAARTELTRVFRVYTGCALALLLLVGVTPNSRTPAVGDVPPTFTPEMTPAPSPTALVTALPPPISRPEDAHGILWTTSPIQAPAFHPPAPPPAQWLASSDYFSVPCSVHARRVFVPVVVAGKAKTFVLGSAAPFSTIDPATSAPSPNDPIMLRTVQIGDLRFNDVVVSVGPVDAFAQTYLGAPADGVLGQELFERFPVRIDFAGCSVTIYRDSAAAKADAARVDATKQQAVALRMTGRLPTIEAKVSSTNTVLAIDTASDADVDVSQQFVTATGLAFSSQAVPELRRALPDGELSGRTARASSLSIGPLSLDAPLLGIMSGPARLPAGVAGFLGDGILDSFVVLIDEQASLCVLTPQPPRAQPYDRSGLWLVQRQNGIAVKSVLPGSPAGVAGMRAGDHIVAVNGQAVPDLDATRALFLQPAGTTLVVTYLRGGARHSVSLGLKTLI